MVKEISKRNKKNKSLEMIYADKCIEVKLSCERWRSDDITFTDCLSLVGKTFSQILLSWMVSLFLLNKSGPGMLKWPEMRVQIQHVTRWKHVQVFKPRTVKISTEVNVGKLLLCCTSNLKWL